MKNLLLLIFVISSTYSFSQTNFSINLLGNVNYSFSKYSYNEGRIDTSLTYHNPLGKSFHLELEFPISPKLSVVGGLRYIHKIIHPRLLLPPAYGTEFPTDAGPVYVFAPFLAKHEFQMAALSISFKHHLYKGEQLAFYGALGMVANFKFKEIETYKTSHWDAERLKDEGIENHFAYTDNQINLFSTAIETGLGVRYKIGPKFGLILQTSAHILEFHKANAKFKKNGDMLWEKTFLPIGQVSLGIGIQRFF